MAGQFIQLVTSPRDLGVPEVMAFPPESWLPCRWCSNFQGPSSPMSLERTIAVCRRGLARQNRWRPVILRWAGRVETPGPAAALASNSCSRPHIAVKRRVIGVYRSRPDKVSGHIGVQLGRGRFSVVSLKGKQRVDGISYCKVYLVEQGADDQVQQ